MNNENNEIKENNNKRKKKVSLFIRIPKVIKIIMCVVLVGVVFSLGIICDNVLSHKEDIIDFGFNNVGKLVTQEWYGRIIEDSVDDRKFFNLFSLPLTTSRQLFSLDVTVNAAVDFEKIRYDIKENKIVVSLPHAEVYQVADVENSMVIYIDSTSLFSRIDLKENDEARNAIKDKAKGIALENGLLDKADSNAQTIIKNFIVSNNKYKDYKIEFKYL